MSNNQNASDKHLLEIITKFKNGEATAAEIMQIERWYDRQTANEGYTDHMSSEERLATQQMMLMRIYDSIKLAQKPTIKLSKRKWLITLSIAASMLLAIGISMYIGLSSQKVVNHSQIVNNVDVAPGSDKAILTLANGKKISLAALTNGEVVNQNGVRIAKTANGQLVYEVTGNSASKNLKPEFNTIDVPLGGQWQVILPDHSKVWLNALSSITYPLQFIGKERVVKISGEAYFEVAHNAQMPFKVNARNEVIEVLGTHFNVAAYADEKQIKTTLLQGSVKISDGKITRLLVPGEQAVANSGKITVTNDIDMEEVVAWKNGYFKFDDNLETIMAKVAKWYNVDVIYEFKPDPNNIYAGKVSRSKNISSLLKIIEFNGDVHFKIDGRRVIVTK